MKGKILLMATLVAFVFNVSAQVKIGDNPGTINSNSLLEMESTNKGFLPPRIAINSLSSVAPLSGTVTTGMLVYSTGGTVTDGYYYWNGSAWTAISTSKSLRNNYVLVKSASDFPAASGGIITLAANTTYEINGIVTVSDEIDLNGSEIRGVHNAIDQLIYTASSGDLFTGSKGGIIQNILMSANAVGTQIFNIDAANLNVNMRVENCFLVYSDRIGILKNFAGTIYLTGNAYQNNTHGFTLQNDSNLIIYNTLWDNSNSGVYHTLNGQFANIQILGGAWQTSFANSSTAIDISGITSITGKAFLKSVLFLGDGVHVNGTFSSAWEVESSGLETEKDDIASGNIYMTAVATTTFSSSNTPVKIKGTTTAASLFRVTSPVTNRMQYAGTKIRRFSIISSLSIVSAGTSKTYSFYIAKNGIIIPESRQLLKMQSSQDKASITLSCTNELLPNDYIEVWIENDSDTSSAVIETMNLEMK